MKANELMIGDLVTFKDCQYDDEIVVIKIYQINQEGDALVFIDDSEVLDEVTIDEEFVGIPLTPEILEKNGWIKKDIFMEFKTEYPDIKLDWTSRLGSSLYRNDHYMCDCDYVHELQHALKLCRIDKTIEL